MMSDKLRAAAQAALDAMSVVRVFVTSKEKIKHPEGTDWYDNIRINLDENIVNNIKEMNAIEAALAEPTVKESLTVAGEKHMNPSDKYEQIKDIKRLNPVELEAMVLKHDQQIKDIAAHLLELKQLVTPMMEFKRREWVGLTDEEITEIRLKMFDAFATNYEAYRAIETKLKEKNGG
jgi:hypothetical protein